MSRIAAGLMLAALMPLAPATANDGGSPAGAPFEKIVEHDFHAPIPCGLVCPYWLYDESAVCEPQQLALPPPNGMYDDWDFDLTLPASAPATGIVFFVFALSPAVDHDGWLCLREAHPDNPGAYQPSAVSYLPASQCSLDPIGCAEKNEINVCVDKAWTDDLAGFNWACIPHGAPVRYRDYNWGDPIATVPAWVCWSRDGIRQDGKGCAGAPSAGR